MAQHNCTYQQQRTVSVNRNAIVDFAKLDHLDPDDYRVFLILLTQLDGFKIPEPGDRNFMNYKDPMNFKKIDVEQIAHTLDIKKKKVKGSISLLTSLNLLEIGDNDTVMNGYRFTF